MHLVVDPQATVRCLYDETIDLANLGHLEISRASHVEPDEVGLWWADLRVSGGPKLGPFPHRSEALAAERTWIEQRLCSAAS